MRSRVAVGVSAPVATGGLALGALLVAAAPRYPVALTVIGGVRVGPAFGVWPLQAVIVVVPAVVAVMLLLVRQRGPAMALVSSMGVMAVGRVLADVQLLRDPIRAARPELVAPLGAGELRPGPGAWLLVGGEVLVALAGLAASGRTGALRGERSMEESPIGPRTPPGAMLWGVACAGLAGFGMLLAPYSSTDPWLVPRSVLDAPVWTAAGGFALAVGVALVVVLACSTPDPRVAVGGLVGLALAVLGVAVPVIVAAVLAPALAVTVGPLMTLLGALGLGGLAMWVGYRGRRGVPPRLPLGLESLLAPPASVLAVRCRLAGALLAVSAGAAAVGAALAEPLRLAPDLPHPHLAGQWVVLVAGVAVLPLGGLTGSRRLGPVLRPALTVALISVPMAAGGPLAELLPALGLDGVAGGPGLSLMLAAVALAVLAGLGLVLAGGFERDDVEMDEVPYEGPFAAASAASAALAVPAFWLPLVDGVGWGTTGVLQPPFGLASWGLLAGFATTAGALLICPRCRPSRALALLGGVATVLVVRLVWLVAGTGALSVGDPGEGAWASMLCVLLVLVTLAVALRARPLVVLSSVAEAGAQPEREEVRR
jgi:hypothetical protein